MQPLQQHCCVDYIVQGEGEITLAALLEVLVSQRDFSGLQTIAGLAFRQAGQIIINDGPQVVPEIDSIPFPYKDGEMDKLKDKIIYYEMAQFEHHFHEM